MPRKELAISFASVSPLSYSQGLPFHPAGQRSGPALVVVPAAAGDERDSAESGHPAPLNGLTPRDVEVLQFLAQGWTTSAIARELAYAESTIKKEVHLIVHRLGARNRTHAVALAIRTRVI